MKAQTITYKGMKYSTKEINMNFKIKVYGKDENGKRINKAVGVKGLIELVGVDFANKFLKRAFLSMEDKETCKLRRGIAITFYRY